MILPEMLAAKISHQIEPSIERLRRAVAGQERFSVSNFGINEDGEYIGVIGLRCEEEPKMQKPALSFAIVVSRFSSSHTKTALGYVMWSIPWIRERQDGLTAYEAKTKPMKFGSDLLPAEFLHELPRLEDAFHRALRHGKPPRTLVALWRKVRFGLPMPAVIRLR